MKERILNYLKGALDQEEKRRFEHEMMRNEFLNQLEKLDFEEIPKKSRRFVIRRKHLLAAVIVIIAVISIVFYKKSSGISKDEIFASYYRAYKSDYSTSFFRVFPKNNLNNAYSLYDKGNYPEAISLLKTVIRCDTTNTNAYFLLGVSFIETQNYKEAIKSLSYVIGRDNYIADQTEWYLALCYLKTGQIKEATSLLNNLANRYYYQSKAVDILRRIK